MKKVETRKVVVTYCDFCGEEINGSHSVHKLKDGKEFDLHDDITYNEQTLERIPSCLEKFRIAKEEKK